MAWRSSGSTNTALINNLFAHNLINSPRVKAAMLAVDRAHYSPASPYEDSPQSIGHSATISAPHMHAMAAESLLPYLSPQSQPKSTSTAANQEHSSQLQDREIRILDIGSGSGYLTHVLANLVTHAEGEETQQQPPKAPALNARVIGIDHIQPLVDLASANMSKSTQGRALLQSGTVAFVCGDGRKGWPAAAPYDAIHVGAAAKEAHPALIEQLRAPGRMFIPVEEEGSAAGIWSGNQYIWVIDKAADGRVERRREVGVRYVPLGDPPSKGS